MHLGGLPRKYDFVFAWSKGPTDDREGDGDRFTACDADREPSLGTTFLWDQRRWAANGATDDLEREHDGREPSLGSLCGDQRRWAAGGDQDEREEQHDAEPDDHHCCPNLELHNQRRLGTYEGEPTPSDPDEDPDAFTARIEIGMAC